MRDDRETKWSIIHHRAEVGRADQGDIAERFHALCLKDSGVLYKDPYVQIGIKAEWRNHQGPLDLSTSWLEYDPGPIFTPETFELPDGVSQLQDKTLWDTQVRGEFFWITNIALVPSSLKSAPNENMQYDIHGINRNEDAIMLLLKLKLDFHIEWLFTQEAKVTLKALDDLCGEFHVQCRGPCEALICTQGLPKDYLRKKREIGIGYK
ncbi:hypothetical protein L2E82_38486 [Cichorium intybus]|uniref:Uncharacterized protein n=1 Tax=Cichorium intybus TaxID=13427 RepID=A0ACB9AFI6_CICIN|nr:hypothetical protein L2E82_38486 [Cichorium intybus]